MTTPIAASLFHVTVQPSGRTFQVDADTTLLAASISQAVGLPYGCKDGACGSCKCKLLSGQVSHGQHYETALSPEEESAGYVLTCCAHAHSDLQLESKQVTPFGAFPIKKLPTRVMTLTKVTNDVMVLKLQLPANDNFQYQAGQYIDFILRDGDRRSYSMASIAAAVPVASLASTPSGNPALLELHIRHMPGGKFTDHVFGTMKEKEILRLEGPFGSFYLREDSESPVVMLASGTGFAPIKALLENMHAKNLSRKTWLYWGARRPVDLYMNQWVVEFAASHSWLQYVPVVSDALAEDGWNGRTGLVHRAVLNDHPDLSGFQVYACGVPAMVDAARTEFSAVAGLDPDAYFADAFISQADVSTNSPATNPA